MAQKVVKEVGAYVGVFVLVLAGYWLYNSYKEDVLDYSFDLLGTRLMAMVPEGPQQDAIQDLFGQFVEQARENKIAPERLETVAANIFNLSQTNAKLTTADVQAFLFAESPAEVRSPGIPDPTVISEIDDAKFEFSESPSTPGTPDPPVLAAVPAPESPLEDSELPVVITTTSLAELSKQMKTVYDFEQHLEAALAKADAEIREARAHMRVKGHNGLKITLDQDFSKKVGQQVFTELRPIIRELEKQKMILWRESMTDEVRAELKRLKAELHALYEQGESKQDKEAVQRKINALHRVAALKRHEAARFARARAFADSTARAGRADVEIRSSTSTASGVSKAKSTARANQ